MSGRAFNPVLVRRQSGPAARRSVSHVSSTRASGATAGTPRFLASGRTTTSTQAPTVETRPINERGDRWEREATRAAETVVRQPVSTTTATVRPPSVSGEPRSRVVASEPLPGHSGGRALAPEQRRRLERTLGADLSAVRVHTSAEAQQTATAVNARAFTVGNHIYLGPGHSVDDARLVAHEAAHTVQQSAAQNAAYAHGPPQSAATPQLSQAPAGMIQRDAATDSDREEGFLERGFWSVVEELAPQWLVNILHEVRDVGFWEFLKRRITRALDGIFSFLQGRGGITAQLANIFRRLLDRGRVIVAALIAGNCEPLFAAVRELRDVLSQMAGDAWSAITDFFRPVGEYLSGLWERFGAPVVDFLRETAGEVWEGISRLGNDLWEYTAPVRRWFSSAWTSIKDLLGFGQGGDDDGSGGITGWISQQAGLVWNEIKQTLEPVVAPIRAVAEKIRSILPLDAILNLRDTVTHWMDNATTMADTMEQEDDIAENQEFIRDIILPGIRRAIQGVRDRLTSAQAWVTAVIGDFAGSVVQFFSSLSANPLLGPLSGTIQWLSDEARSLGEWAVDTVGGVFSLADRALVSLNTWIAPILRGLQRLVTAISNLMENLGDFVLGPFMLIPRCIRDPIKDFLIQQILGRIPVFSQLLALPDIWTRVQTVFRRIVVQVFRDGNLFGAAWTFFREVLQLFGLPPQLVTNLIRNAARAIGDILRDPFGFLMNLLNAVKTGFLNFLGNFGTHLLDGIANWLFGTLGEAGIRVPTEFSLRSVVDVVVQVLGITRDRIFAAIERRVGPERAAQIRRGLGIAEEVLGFVQILINEGPAGLWREILNRLSNLWDTIVSGVMDFVIGRIVAFATRWVMSLLDISGVMPVINSLIAIYNAIQSFFRYLRQLLEILNSVFEGLGEIARGVITRGANLVESNLARIMPIAIGFLANQLGIGDLPQQILRVVGRIRERVDRALDWIVDRIVRGTQAVVSAARSAVGAVRNFLFPEKRFEAGGEPHRIYFEQRAGHNVPTIASEPLPLTAFLANAQASSGIPDTQKALIPQAQARVNELNTLATELETATGAQQQAKQRELSAKEEQVAELIQRILSGVRVGAFDDRYRLEGMVGTYGVMPRQTGDRLTPDHQPQASILLYAARRNCMRNRRIQNVVGGGHVEGGVCINVHHFRHVRGRTYGRSPDTGAIDRAVSNNPGNEPAQRSAIVSALRAELLADVARMETVAGNTGDRDTWQDIHSIPGATDAQRTQIISQVSGQIRAGVRRIAAQNIEQLAEPS